MQLRHAARHPQAQAKAPRLVRAAATLEALEDVLHLLGREAWPLIGYVSEWGLIVLSALMGLFMVGMRRRMR